MLPAYDRDHTVHETESRVVVAEDRCAADMLVGVGLDELTDLLRRRGQGVGGTEPALNVLASLFPAQIFDFQIRFPI